MKRILIFWSVIIVTFCSNYGQKGDFIRDSLDTYIQRGMIKWGIPGTAVCLVKDGKVILSRGYGVRESGINDKVDENTLFLIGSNTKAFTGTALALLEYEGKISLEDKVQKWLPDFQMRDPWVAGNLNLTDILTHRIGLQTFQGDFMYWTSDLTPDEVIQKFGLLTPRYDFRTKYGYTNAGFAIAGKIIETATDTLWNDFVKARFFTPLQMNRTVPLSAEFFSADNAAKPHTLVNDKVSPISFPSIDNLAPAGSIASTANDLSRWLLAQLDSGNFKGRNVIPYKVIQKTREPQTIIRRARHPFNKSNYLLYGLGWQLEDYTGKEIVSHTGAVNGFVTSVTLIPEERVGIVVLTNTDMNLFYQSLKWELIDAMLGLEYRNYDDHFYNIFNKNLSREKDLLTARKDTVKMKPSPELPIDGYSGNYKNEVYGSIEITKAGDKLEMYFEHHSTLKGILEPLGGNRFLCTYNDPAYGTVVIPFKSNNNQVESLTLSVNDFVEYTTYEFMRVSP